MKHLLKILFKSAGFSVLFGSLVAWLWIFGEIAIYGHVRLEEHDLLIWTLEVLMFSFGLCFVIWLFKQIT